MQPYGAAWIGIGMVASGSLGLLVLLAPALGRNPKQTAEGWVFPVKFTSLLAFWAGLATGLSAVAYGGYSLLASVNSNWSGWASFAIGFALVLFVVSHWPAPLLFDQSGLLKRGSPDTRILWEHLAYVRQYQIRNDRGIVIHSACGKQLVFAEMTYNSTQILDRLLELYPIPLHTLEEESVPSIMAIRGLPWPEEPNSSTRPRISLPVHRLQRPD